MRGKRFKANKKRWCVQGLLLCGAIGALGSCGLQAERPPLFPRALILEDADRTVPRLSPDGKRLAYVAAFKGISNIWIKTLGRDDDRAVTLDSGQGIDSYRWRQDGRALLYFQDQGGDETTHLFQVDIETGKVRDMTPLPGVRASTLIDNPRYPTVILVHLNARDRSARDLYRLDLETGALVLTAENPGRADGFIADNDMRARAVEIKLPDGSTEIRVRDADGTPWRFLLGWGPGEIDSDNTGVLGFNAANDKLLLVSSLDADAERLMEVDCRTGERKVLGQDSHFDLNGWMINPLDHALEAVSFLKDRTEWTFFNRRVREDFGFLGTVREGEIRVSSRDRADRTWVASFRSADRPTAYYLFDRAARTATFLFSEDPKLESVRFAKMEPIRFPAQDGLIIHGYLTCPLGLEARSLPLVVLVHGGPWTKDTWSLNFVVQWLANRGYAVLQVNFRGSTGYGKAYQNAGDREWGGRIIQDLVDGKNWAVTRGIADPRRTAIMGGSFGGYAVLAALAFRPVEFSCGVDMSGPSDLNAFLADMPARWATTRGQWEKRMGKDPEFLRSISPLFQADRIVRPLFISHNANDTRVRLDQADRIAAAVRKSGKEVTYLVFPNAGHIGGGGMAHHFRRYAAIEDFLGRHLGGRVEPPSAEERWESLKK
jgi:dipeptidyl aminopeptidase/acylaminoacyl peptidase